MKALALLLAAGSLAPISRAQWDVALSGYVVDFPAFQVSSPAVAELFGTGREQFVNTVRVRLRPVVGLWGDAQLSLEYECAALYQSSGTVFQDTSLESRGQVVELRWTPLSTSHWRAMHCVDRLYYRQGFTFGELTLGRQRIAWGTGRIWNPTDLFNPLNRANYTKIEKDGVDALLLKIFLGSFTDLSLVYNPAQEWDTENAGLRFRTNVEEFDLSLMGGYFDGRTVIGGDCVGNFFGAGLRGEVILSGLTGQASSRFASYIFGVDYQFTATLYGLAEYHHNGEGSLDRDSYDLQRLVRGEILNLAKDYLALGTTWQLHPLLAVSATVTLNLNDGSDFVSLSATYAVTEECSLSAGGQLFLGSDRSEYWYYPDALYLKADVYF
jgi:hypothetical protein